MTEGEGVARLVGTLVNNAEDPDRLLEIDVDTEVGPSSVTLAKRPIVTTVPVKLEEGAYRDVEVDRPPDGDIRPGG